MTEVVETRHLSPASVSPDATERLLRWLLAAGADELSVRVRALRDEPAALADAFEDALAPFALPNAPRPVLADAEHADGTREVRLWVLSDESITALAPFLTRGLFHHEAGPAGWLEDLTVYRAGELVLGVLTHEREGILRLTPGEHAEVAAIGVLGE